MSEESGARSAAALGSDRLVSRTARMIGTDRAANAPNLRVGYVLKVFPRVSETFVINEMIAMERLGAAVATFSLHSAEPAADHAILRHKRGPTLYVDALPAPPEALVRRAAETLSRRFGLTPEERGRVLPRKYVRLAVSLASLAAEQRVEHLHAHFASRATHVTALAAALAELPFTFTAHAKDIYHREVDADVLRWKIAQARCCVTVSDYNREHLQRLVDPSLEQAGRIVRLYNGVDTDRFRAAPHPTGVPLILAVGRLVPKKGFPVLIEACRLLHRAGVGFRCEIVGGGPEEPGLRAAIASAGLDDRVALRGVMTTEEVAERLQVAAVVTLPCIVADDGNVDALPTVLLEAMASARPVVSTRVSGIPEIVQHGETGFLVAPNDAAGLAGALSTILGEPALAAAMGRRGRQRCERLFDLHTNARRLYELLLGERSSAAAR